MRARASWLADALASLSHIRSVVSTLSGGKVFVSLSVLVAVVVVLVAVIFIVERIMQVVTEYEERLRKMQWVPRFSYGRGLLRKDLWLQFFDILCFNNLIKYSSSFRESLWLQFFDFF
jgi:hypothetical protein